MASFEPSQHCERGFAFGGSGGMGQRGIYNQTVAAFQQDMAHMAKAGGLAASLFEQPSVGIRGRDVGGVAALFAMEITFGITAFGPSFYSA
jgi:hypothetical protein